MPADDDDHTPGGPVAAPEPDRVAIARSVLTEWALRYAGLIVAVLVALVIIVIAPTASPR